jgi:hypothetical protein
MSLEASNGGLPLKVSDADPKQQGASGDGLRGSLLSAAVSPCRRRRRVSRRAVTTSLACYSCYTFPGRPFAAEINSNCSKSSRGSCLRGPPHIPPRVADEREMCARHRWGPATPAILLHISRCRLVASKATSDTCYSCYSATPATTPPRSVAADRAKRPKTPKTRTRETLHCGLTWQTRSDS